MINLVEHLTDLLKGDNLSKIASFIGADSEAAGKGIAAALPVLINGVAKNMGTPAGLQTLLGDLTTKYDGSLLDNLGGFLSNPTGEGASLLSSFLGGEQAQAEQKVAKVSGLTEGVVGRLLPVLAPIVLNAIGSAVKSQNLDVAGLGEFLMGQQSMIRNSAPGLMGFLERIDANDDNNVLDDLQRLVGRFFGR